MADYRDPLGKDAPHARRMYAVRVTSGYGTAEAFAEKLGVLRPRISNVEGGRPLSIQLARIIKTRTGFPLEWLMEGDWGALLPKYRDMLHAAGFPPGFDTEPPSEAAAPRQRKRKTSAG